MPVVAHQDAQLPGLRLAPPATGGLGDVAERDPAAVARDVEEGYVSPEAAKEVYGRD